MLANGAESSFKTDCARTASSGVDTGTNLGAGTTGSDGGLRGVSKGTTPETEETGRCGSSSTSTLGTKNGDLFSPETSLKTPEGKKNPMGIPTGTSDDCDITLG